MSWLRDVATPLAIGTTAAVLMTAAPASATHTSDHSCTGNAQTRRGGGEAGGVCQSGPSTGSRGSAPAPICDPNSQDIAYYDDPRSDDEELVLTYARLGRRDPPPDGMRWAGAFNCDGRYLGGPYLVPDPEWVDIGGVRDVAKARATPPLPVPNVSPAEAVVRTPTWLWVDDASWRPISATASEGDVTVRVEARPVRVTWDLEEGVRVCHGPGIPWSEEAQADYDAQPEESRGRGNPACTFTFRHSSTVTEDDVYHASVTVTWEFSWWLNGDAQGVFGSIDRSSQFDLRVGEVQAVITDY